MAQKVFSFGTVVVIERAERDESFEQKIKELIGEKNEKDNHNNHNGSNHDIRGNICQCRNNRSR